MANKTAAGIAAAALLVTGATYGITTMVESQGATTASTSTTTGTNSTNNQNATTTTVTAGNGAAQASTSGS